MAKTVVADVIVPTVYTRYQQAMTEAKSRFVSAGILVRDPEVDGLLGGGGLTFNMPKWNDLPDDAVNISLGATGSPITPNKITSFREIGVRMNRNQAWGAVDLAGVLAGDDPMRAIASRVSPYWTRQLQLALLAAAAGVFADNTANDGGDLTVDLSTLNGGVYQAGTTDFSAEAFIDACHTMGDSEEDLGIVVMHSVVYAKAKKNNLIDFIPDAINPNAKAIPTFLGRVVVVDDGAPKTGSVYQTLMFGPGAFRLGVGQPPVPVATERDESDAGGGGSEALFTRVEWCIHPVGHAFVAGSIPDGGPSNASTANNLAHAASWDRRVAERKMVKMARLITREA